jgi:telomere length regulation protein
MVIGTGMSELIEEPGKAMKFDLEEMRSEEALWYLSLIKVYDEPGSPDSVRSLQTKQCKTQQPVQEARSEQSNQSKARSSRPQTSKIVAIEEIEDSGDETEEDLDLIPYEKPDEDEDDDDEDPTLVQRNKPAAPVYVFLRSFCTNAFLTYCQVYPGLDHISSGPRKCRALSPRHNNCPFPNSTQDRIWH